MAKSLKELIENAEETIKSAYEKGYYDGRMAREAEIVRCKDCKWYDLTDPCGTLTPNAHRCKRVTRLWMEDDAYCSYGERRADEESIKRTD